MVTHMGGHDSVGDLDKLLSSRWRSRCERLGAKDISTLDSLPLLLASLPLGGSNTVMAACGEKRNEERTVESAISILPLPQV